MKYEPTRKSIKQHKVPDWFHDAKFGIFIHWGLFSIPAFAVTGLNLIESEKRGPEVHFKNNPYAEWYLNSLRIEGSPTQEYHREVFGDNFSYDDFIDIFNEEIKKWNPSEWAELFKQVGAKYVVLVTKHHDGFLLWPSKFKNPKKENYQASRDIVGELSKEVRKLGMRFGVYYSGVLDWSFNPEPIKDDISFLENHLRTPEYIEYANNHWYELIDKYEPKILWNDIGYVPTNAYKIVAYYYNKVPDGIINDRWMQMKMEGENFRKIHHRDFFTPEYEIYDQIIKKKWETSRGVGNSYGFNRMETEEHYLKSSDLIKMIIDVVSKNGNLLLNFGPRADGSIPDLQKKAALGLGKWLEINGEAIYGTRPWIRAEGKTIDNIEVRFTKKVNSLFMTLLEKPKAREIIIKSLLINANSKIQLLGYRNRIAWSQIENNLSLEIPKDFFDSPAYTFKISPIPNHKD
ncbi:MAG: alpha-L-fucosidase [Candidatus Heimdallarchaeota archaeon]